MLGQDNNRDGNQDLEALSIIISKAIMAGLTQAGLFSTNNIQQENESDRNDVDWQVSSKEETYKQNDEHNIQEPIFQPDFYGDDLTYQLIEDENYNNNLPLYDHDNNNLTHPTNNDIGITLNHPIESSIDIEDEAQTDNRSAAQIAGRIYGSEWVVMQNELLYAIGNLTADERKLIMYLSPLVRRMIDKDPNQNTFNVVASDFADFYDMELRYVYKKLEDISNSMVNKSFFLWNFYKNERHGAGSKESADKRGISWLGEVGYRKKRGILEVELTSTVIGMLTVFDKMHPYTKYQRSLITNLTHYGIVLFELIMSCMHQDFKKRTFTVDYLREKFNCTDLYPKISEFKRNVLDKAIEDVGNLGVMTVSYEQKKKGREVTAIVFSFTDNSEGALEGIDNNEDEQYLGKPLLQSEEDGFKNKVMAKPSKPKNKPTPTVKGDIFKSESQRREFSQRLSQLKQLAHMATGATNTYEAFANKIYEDLKDVEKQGFYKPFLDMVQFNASVESYDK